MRKHIVAGNWKMNLTFTEADELLDDLMSELEKVELPRDTQVIVCPPFPYIEMASDYANDSYFAVGAQNVSDQEKGAYTGEVSAAMLESCEIDYCIVGHSERRAYYGETDALVAAKVDQLLAHNFQQAREQRISNLWQEIPDMPLPDASDSTNQVDASNSVNHCATIDLEAMPSLHTSIGNIATDAFDSRKPAPRVNSNSSLKKLMKKRRN
jgi:hypothetical protein